MKNIGLYAKAIVAFVTPGLVALGAALVDTSDAGSGVSGREWVGIALACLATAGVVAAVPNARQSDPPPAPDPWAPPDPDVPVR
jgi:hypothetical protein